MAVLANRYELGRALGSGGFATVYRARDNETRRDVAIKIIPQEVAVEDAERFRLEALALSQLRSPNVVRVHDFGKDDASHGLYLVMDLVEGVTLDPTALGRPLLGHEVLRAARALLSGLSAVHSARLVHRDIKPANVLVPGGIAGLSDLKLIDFGIARSEHRAQLDAEEGLRHVIGTPAYMAPEILLGEECSASSDVYSAGLVLYELLGHTRLFPEQGMREQLALRTKADPALAGLVPAPLDLLLARMLERDPAKRFADATEALGTLLNMETAPIDMASLGLEAAQSTDKRQSFPPSSQPPSRRSRSSLTPPAARTTTSLVRLQKLDADPITALRTTLHAMDLSALDALARRDRGREIGRVARAIALAMRLEIDAAALVLMDGPPTALVRATASCLLVPRARVATRARLIQALNLDDASWLDEVDLELGQLFVSIEAALSGPVAMLTCQTRCDRVLARSPIVTQAWRTLTVARIATSAYARGAHEEGTAAIEKLRAEEPDDGVSPFCSTVRSILLGTVAFRADDHLARASFERAAQMSGDAGCALFEVRALIPLGGMLVEVAGRLKQGVALLERATTLLLHADTPSLEHLAAHNRGVALLVEGDFGVAADQFRRAREAASGEVPMELELMSGAQEVIACLAAGDHESARATAKLIEASRFVPVAPREALLTAVACSLVRLADNDLAGARETLAHAANTSDTGARDALLVVEAIRLVYAAGAGEEVDFLARAAALHRTGEEHGYAPFYWFEAIRALVTHLPDGPMKKSVSVAVERLLVLLAPAKKP